jgi:archaemetzincin
VNAAVLAPYVLAAVLSTASAPRPVTVALQPLGGVSAAALRRLARSLEERIGVRVELLAAEPLPDFAYYAPRCRYRAADLVAFLDRTTAPAVPFILGVTARDISSRKGAVADWGVFGVAKLGGRPSVVSTYRLRAGGVSQAAFEKRLARVAAHELAHSLGLRHCDGAHCLMNDAGGSIRSVDDATDFCEKCRKELASRLT